MYLYDSSLVSVSLILAYRNKDETRNGVLNMLALGDLLVAVNCQTQRKLCLVRYYSSWDRIITFYHTAVSLLSK